jgi:hypothetical protein
MNPEAGNAGVIISWSLGESRERLVFHPCIIRIGVFSDPPAKYRSTEPMITPPAARIIIL